MTTVDNGDRISRATVDTQEPVKLRPPTSTDVARLAQVSRATVSFVLNDVPDSRITAATRARVLAAAEELGYIPNASASALATGHNHLVLIPFFNLPSYGRVLNTYYDLLAGRLTELGYTVLFHRDRHNGGPEIVRRWAALRPAGLIVASHRLDAEALEVLHRAGARAILSVDLTDPSSTGVEDVGVAVAQHLINAGHQRLAMVVPREPELVPLGLARFKSFEQSAQAHGVSVERIDLSLDEKAAFVLAQRWRRNPHPTGVFGYNDEYAMMLMRALLDSGMAVPGDVAIVGCDNMPMCDFLRPRLTSISPPVDVLGRAVADVFHEMILGHPQRPAVKTPVQLQVTVRESG
jgi:DNA-binding LacI/PurR family transcriptional regulator